MNPDVDSPEERIWLWLAQKAYRVLVRVGVLHEKAKEEALQKTLAKEGPKILGAGVFLGAIAVLAILSTNYAARSPR